MRLGTERPVESVASAFAGRRLLTAASLTTITLVAGILRFYCLGEWSLWQDEAYTWRDARNATASGFLSSSLTNQAIGWTISAIGATEWSLRLFPAIVGILTVPVLYFPIQRLFGSGVALLSVALIAVSHWHLYWSQNARFYTTLMLFFTLALLAMISWLEYSKNRYLFAALIFLLLAVHERLVGLMLMPVFGVCILLIYAFGFKSKLTVRWSTLGLAIFGLVCVGAFFAFPYFLDPDSWLEAFGWANNGPFWLVASISYYLTVPLIFTALVGSLVLGRDRPIAALALIVAAVLPSLTLVALSSFHYTASRYAFMTLPAWAILGACGLRYFLNARQREVRYLAVAMFLTVIFVSLGENFMYYAHNRGNRTDWKPAFQYLLLHQREHDLVFIPTPLLADFYSVREAHGIGQLDLTDTEIRNKRVWLFEDMTTQGKHPRILSWFKRHAKEMANFDVWVRARNFRLQIYLYEPDYYEEPLLSTEVHLE